MNEEKRERMEHLRFAAERLLFDLEERTSKFRYTKEQKVGVVCGHLQEMCSTGHSIALNEVRSTPWEYNWCTLNVEEMNKLSEQGWELLQAIGAGTPLFIWRRRRAVREIEKTFEPQSS